MCNTYITYNMAQFLKILITKVIVNSIVLVYGVLVSLNLLFKWIQKGNQFWGTKQRKTKPEILTRPEYGAHSFIQLKVTIKIRMILMQKFTTKMFPILE